MIIVITNHHHQTYEHKIYEKIKNPLATFNEEHKQEGNEDQPISISDELQVNLLNNLF